MIVDNFKSVIGRCLSNSTTEAYFPITSTSGEQMSLSTDVSIMTRPMVYCKSNTPTTDYGTFLCVGTSDEVAVRHQINLMEYCDDVECLASKSFQYNSKEDQDYLFKINSLISLPSDSVAEQVTIKEIGVFYKSTNALTCISSIQSVICMIYREVLDEPIILKRGELHNFSVEIKMLDSDADNLVKIIPLMTGYNTPSGEVKASGYDEGYPPYNAFNRQSYVRADSWCISRMNASSENYIQYESERMFYPITIRYNSFFRRRDEEATFTYMFSVDGEQWDEMPPIDLRRWQPPELGSNFVFPSTGIHQPPSTYDTFVPKEMRNKAYKYFRLKIIGCNEENNVTGWVTIPDLQIYGRFA